MTGFVASPPPTEADPQAPEQPPFDLVAGDDWYPGITLTVVRDAVRIPTTVTDQRLRDSVRGAMISVRRELAAWKRRWIAAGVAGLVDVDDETIDGESALELLYRRAVCAYAAADLAETHGDISATNEGRERNEERAVPADEHRRNATHAIRDILSVGRTSVELI
ncbi:hypothetical protein FHS96_003096 [Sphingomonas zeicaulis]|uniref:head completion/stabilization protein n=1 Tax=Sphingomonas zeicaulis TaxID=1632740 RepID=UPI003D1B9681